MDWRSLAGLALGAVALLYAFYLVDRGYVFAKTGRWPEAARLWVWAMILAIAVFS